MAYNFVEQVLFRVPDISEGLNSFKDGEFAESHGLVVEIAAIHEGLTQNFTNYREDELERSLSTWTHPYPKPIILNHNIESDPLGRVMGAKMAKEEDGTPFIKLQAAITNIAAIERVGDQRYLTGSVGGKVEEAVCSVCGVDFANESQTPCKHKRGKVYNGKLAALQMGGIEWKEYSFVNAPSDRRSGIKTELQESDSWVRPASFLVMDLNNQNIMQLTEAEGSVDLLSDMRNKEAGPLYLGLKGSYLSVMAIEESLKEIINNTDTSDTTSGNEVDIQSQENPMSEKVSEETAVDQDDNILDAVESLENGTPAEEANAKAEADEVSEDVDSESVEESEQAEESEETQEEDKAQEAEASEGETEDAVNQDAKPETIEEEAKSEEAEATESEKVEEENSETLDETVAEAETEEGTETTEANEQADETELAEQDSVELPVEELKSLVESLRNENTRLKVIVRRHLVEQVVDRKVEVGIVESEDREVSIEEHMGRTASSLVDTLRDMQDMKSVTTEAKEIPQIEEETMAVTDDGSVIEGEEVITSESVEERFEEMVYQTLKGNTQL
jgi:hypothetical protein